MQAQGGIEDQARALAELRTALSRDCEEIAALLAQMGLQAEGRIVAARHRITANARQANAMLPRIDAAGAALAAQARADAARTGERMVLPQSWHDLKMQAGRLRADIGQLAEISALLARQSPPVPSPLYPEAADEPDARSTQAEVGDAVLDRLHKLLTPAAQSKTAQTHGCFPDIGLPQSKFLAHVHAAYRVTLAQRLGRPARFLDVGCGAGLKVVTAAEFFAQADGLEYDLGYADTAAALLSAMGLDRCKVHHADALAFDEFDAYDVIYLYRPMRDAAAMERLEARIAAQARPGTLLIAAYGGFARRHALQGCARIANGVFVTGTDEQGAAALRRAAELVGPDVRRRRTALTSLWEPILAASHDNGYGIPHRVPITV